MNDLHLRDRLFQFQYLQHPNKIIKKTAHQSTISTTNKEKCEVRLKKKKGSIQIHIKMCMKSRKKKKKKLPLDNRA